MEATIKQSKQKIQRANILGVEVSAINMTIAMDSIRGWINGGQQHYVCVTPVHALMDFRRDPDLLRIVNQSGLTTPDGMPLVWVLKLMGFQHVERVYGPDLMLEVCRMSQDTGYRHYFYGGVESVPETLCQNLLKRFPDLEIAGTFSPPFRPLSADEDRRVIERINSADPDIVWVGLGAPKQERWMAEHLGKINAPVMIGVGAAFDFHAGLKKQAPRWMQRCGLEWFFRLITEPKRLWKRYAVNNPLFLLLLLTQVLGIKTFHPPGTGQ